MNAMAPIRGLRGATTVEANTRNSIRDATKELLEALVRENEISPDDIAAAYFTVTSDLNAMYPASVARQDLGWEHVALLDFHQMEVPHSVPNCIRVMLLVNTEKAPGDLKFQYLRGAKDLRNNAGREM